MLRLWRVNFYSICLAFGLSVLLILAGHRYADSRYYYRPSMEGRRNLMDFFKVEYGENSQNIPTIPYDGSPDIRNILEKARAQIKYQLSKYNFSLSGAHVLEDLVLELGGRPLQSLIISTWRSGTTFLGDLLNAIPGTYYHYEPLLYYGILQIRGPPESDQALSTLKHMLKCNYDGLDDYFKFESNDMIHHFNHNTRLWDQCKYKKDLCLDPEFTSRLCKLYPFHAMKVVRLRLQAIREILDDKELNVKVILLIRDPRGVMQSRQHCNFCKPSPDCWEPSLVCSDMISDYFAASQIIQEYPDRLMVLRYEELALKPNITAHRILKFLKLSPTPSLDVFLQSHTNVEVPGFHSTFRVSRNVPFKWKYTLSFNRVAEIQMACKEAMLLWGYKMAHNKTHMTSKDFNPMEDYTISQRT